MWLNNSCSKVFYLDSFHHPGNCFCRPFTSDNNYKPHTIEGEFIQITHIIILKITPLNITYWCLVTDKMSSSAQSDPVVNNQRKPALKVW